MACGVYPNDPDLASVHATEAFDAEQTAAYAALQLEAEKVAAEAFTEEAAMEAAEAEVAMEAAEAGAEARAKVVAIHTVIRTF
jgi:hypothetical protein